MTKLAIVEKRFYRLKESVCNFKHGRIQNAPRVGAFCIIYFYEAIPAYLTFVSSFTHLLVFAKMDK